MSALYTFIYYFPLLFLATVFVMAGISYITKKFLESRYKKGKSTKKEYILRWNVVNYSLLLTYITTFGRRSLDYYRYNYEVGYSYRAAFLQHDHIFLKEILLNVIIFIPLGILCAFAFRRFRLLLSCLYGLILSAFIEYSQLILKKGTFEYDDMISNTAGTLVGFIVSVIILILIKIWRRMKGKR